MHDASVKCIISHTSKVEGLADPCILLIMSIQVYKSRNFVSSLWDSGSTLSLITFKKAKELNLYGKEITLSIFKTGGVQETLKSFSYTLPLQDMENKAVCITVYV